MGQYNLSVFVLMYNNGTSLYRELDSITPVLFVPTELEIEGTAVLESIIYSNYSKSGSGQIIIPYRVYKVNKENLNDPDNPEDINYPTNYYAIIWDFTLLTISQSENNTPIMGEMTITHTNAAGSYIIYASVTISGTTLYRPFYIEVQT